MNILVLAGGFDQIALIKELHCRGNKVLLADYFTSPPAGKFADKHFQVSTMDEDAILALAIQENVNLITTACTDQALMTVASVSEKLGLPCYVSSETAKNVTNKAFMKKKFYEFKIPTAKSILFDEDSMYEKITNNELNYPMIVKPCDCNSSKGVIKVNDRNELLDGIKNAFSLSRSKNVIVESFMEGEEVSIDVWVDSQGAKILSLSETNKLKLNNENFTIYQSKYPVLVTAKLKNKIQNIVNRICKAFSLMNCPVLIQAIINKDNISVIEFSARMGGGSKYKLIEYMSGINIMKVYVNRILGDTSQIITPRCSDKKIELNYIYAYNGIYKALKGFEEKEETGDICELFQYKQKGSKIENRKTSSDRVIGFLIQEDSYESLLKKRYDILESADILDNMGKSMIYKECFY